jgi:hypothetical protein
MNEAQVPQKPTTTFLPGQNFLFFQNKNNAAARAAQKIIFLRRMKKVKKKLKY